MAHMEFRLLGQVTVHAADTKQDLLADLKPQHRLLLAILVLAEGRRVSMERLTDWMWDGAPSPADPHGDLQGLASDVRKGLRAAEPGRPDRLPHGKGGYLITVTSEEVDALRFRDLSVQVKAQVGRDDREVIRLGRLALREWGPRIQGLCGLDPLAGLRGGWADNRREHLRSEYRNVLIYVLDAELRRGNHERLAQELSALEIDGIDRVDQDFARIHMLACSRSKRQGEALDFYRRFTQAARRNGVEISKDLADLALNITTDSVSESDGARMPYKEPRPVLKGITDDSHEPITGNSVKPRDMEVAMTRQPPHPEDGPDRDNTSPEAEAPDAETTESQAAGQETPVGLVQNFGVVIAPGGSFGINR
jgi:DNA-binding SARP family transcriptional activator